jgi:hypothetical protein
MSIVAMKRKSQATKNLSGKSNGGFSLNNPRRVDAHHNDTSIQTRMRGLGYVGHGGKNGSYPIRVVQSSYSNTYDPYTGPRASVKNNSGRISELLQCCDPVVQQTSALDADTYIRNLKIKTTKPDVCNGLVNAASGNLPTTTDCVGTCKRQITYVKPPPMDYSTYYQTVFLNKNGIPLAPEKAHYPPMMARNRTACGSGSIPSFTYEEFKEMNTCPSE